MLPNQLENASSAPHSPTHPHTHTHIYNHLSRITSAGNDVPLLVAQRDDSMLTDGAIESEKGVVKTKKNDTFMKLIRREE